jgi:glycosyltransferase involved in cell wall biosynthesis
MQTAAAPVTATLSILVPAYNAQAHIEACLRSVLPQMQAHHALVVVDDGSTDRTAGLVEGLAREYGHARLTLIRQQNQGISGARNRLLAAATGDYVQWLDADDLLLPGTLAALDDVIATHAPDVVACDFNNWHPDQPRKNRPVALGYPAGMLLREHDAILCSFFADRHIYVWNNVMRRTVYERVAAPVFPVGRVFEDVSVVSSLLARCDSLVRLARPTVDYRQHAGSLKLATSAKWCVDFTQALRQVKQDFSSLPVSDKVRLHIDATACHFYIRIVKNSYQLPWSEGRAAREQVRSLFISSLFHPVEQVLAAMRAGLEYSHDRKFDASVADQVRSALAGNLAFSLAKTASQRLKMWRQRRLAA